MEKNSRKTSADILQPYEVPSQSLKSNNCVSVEEKRNNKTVLPQISENGD